MATIKETEEPIIEEVAAVSLAAFRIVESSGHRSIDKAGKVTGTKDYEAEVTVAVADSDEARTAAVDLYLKLCADTGAQLLRFGPAWFNRETV